VHGGSPFGAGTYAVSFLLCECRSPDSNHSTLENHWQRQPRSLSSRAPGRRHSREGVLQVDQPVCSPLYGEGCVLTARPLLGLPFSPVASVVTETKPTNRGRFTSSSNSSDARPVERPRPTRVSRSTSKEPKTIGKFAYLLKK
jgi:hypothetical protein